MDIIKNVEAERALLGEIILNGSDTFNAVLGLVSADDFFDQNNKFIFNALSELSKQDNYDMFDVIQITDSINKTNHSVDACYIARLTEEALAKVKNTVDKANIIHETAQKRRLQLALDECYEVLTCSYQSDDSEKLKGKLCAVLNSCNNEDISALYEDGAQVALRLINRMKTNESAIQYKTGITKLDVMLDGGLRTETLNIIGARPGVGKSALATGIILNVLKNYKDIAPSIIFSLEMGNDQVMQRIFSSFSGQNGSLIMRNEFESYQWRNLIMNMREALEPTSENKMPRLLLNDKASLTLTDLEMTVSEVSQRFGGVGVVMVDYLQLMPVDTRNQTRASAIGEISRGLKEISRKYKTPVIALCQLNREIENGKAVEPKASHIKDSGSIEQDADVIVLITRDDGKADLHVVKNRNGSTGKVECAFIGNACKFTDFSEEKMLE